MPSISHPLVQAHNARPAADLADNDTHRGRLPFAPTACDATQAAAASTTSPLLRIAPARPRR